MNSDTLITQLQEDNASLREDNAGLRVELTKRPTALVFDTGTGDSFPVSDILFREPTKYNIEITYHGMKYTFEGPTMTTAEHTP